MSLTARLGLAMSAFIRACARVVQPVASSSRIHGFSTSARTSAQVPEPRNWRTPAGHPAPSPLVPPEADAATPIEEDIPVVERHAPEHPTSPEYAAHTRAIRERFAPGESGVRWAPPRKLSRQAMEGLRTLHAHNPGMFTTPVLADKFRLSPEAVRRILKSRWEPSREERMRLAGRDQKWKETWIEKSKARDRVMREAEKQHEHALHAPSSSGGMRPSRRGSPTSGRTPRPNGGFPTRNARA
jgi:hypothetical protein